MVDLNKDSTISFEIKNPMLIVFLLFGMVLLVLEMSIILNRPIAFGDGAYHSYIAKYIGQNEIFPKILPGLNSYYTYSPLLHLLLSIFYLTPFGEILAKAFIPILVLFTGLATFVTVSRVFTKRTAFLASVFILTIPIFATYSVLIYTDILMVSFFILSSMFTFVAEKYGDKKYWILSVIFATMSFLSKGIGIVSFGFIGIVLIYKLLKKDFTPRQFIKLALIVIICSALFTGGWFIRNVVFFKAVDCNLPLIELNCVMETIDPSIASKFAGYVIPSGSNVGVLNFGLKNFSTFMYGIMWLVPFSAIVGVVLLVSRRERPDYFNLFLLFLTILPAIVIFYIGISVGAEHRTEDIARYMILTAFTIPLIAAIFIDKFLESVKKYWKYFSIIILIVVIFISWLNFKDKLNTMSRVTQFSPAFFEACNFIKANTEKDAKFLTLWAGPTAYNCERTARWESNYLPDIVLSQDLENVLNGLEATGTDYIFIQKFAMSQVPYQASIPIIFVQLLENNPSHFEKIYENGLPLQNCISQGGCDGTIIYKVLYNE